MNVAGNPLSTQKSYIRGVRDLMEGLQSVPEALTVDQIKAHLASWRGKVSSSALNLRVCGIKYYFKHVVKRPDLAVDVPNPRVAKYVQEVLGEEDLATMFDACLSMRELSVLHLLFDCGLRSREVCHLKLTDFENENERVTFEYKDYKDGGKKKEMQLTAEEFIRRFTQHILPPKFRRIRHYGFLSNTAKGKALERARHSLGVNVFYRLRIFFFNL